MSGCPSHAILQNMLEMPVFPEDLDRCGRFPLDSWMILYGLESWIETGLGVCFWF